MGEFKMPSLGADMDAGTLVSWRVKPGDAVKRGEVIADVETQKGVIEVEVWEDGVVEELVVPEGEKVPVGTVLALLREPGAPARAEPSVVAAVPAGAEAAVRGAVAAGAEPGVLGAVAGGTEPAVLAAAPTSAEPAAPAAAPAGGPAAAAGPGPERGVVWSPPGGGPPPSAASNQAVRTRASPAARKRAEALGVDLATLTGTGPGGAVSVADVERAAAAAAPEPRAAMRAAIAAAMARSKREIPHYYLAAEADVQALTSWLEARNRERPLAERMLLVVPLVKAVALALKDCPELNGHFVDGAFRPAAAVHVGVAIALRGGGLVAPAVRDVARRSLDELRVDLADLVRRVRAGTMRSSELTDPTITLTQLGERGADTVFGVIHPPQVAMVGVGQARKVPAVLEDGTIAPRTRLTITLSGDHRVSDGAAGAHYLAELERLLEHPEEL